MSPSARASSCGATRSTQSADSRRWPTTSPMTTASPSSSSSTANGLSSRLTWSRPTPIPAGWRRRFAISCAGRAPPAPAHRSATPPTSSPTGRRSRSWRCFPSAMLRCCGSPPSPPCSCRVSSPPRSASARSARGSGGCSGSCRCATSSAPRYGSRASPATASSGAAGRIASAPTDAWCASRCRRRRPPPPSLRRQRSRRSGCRPLPEPSRELKPAEDQEAEERPRELADPAQDADRKPLRRIEAERGEDQHFAAFLRAELSRNEEERRVDRDRQHLDRERARERDRHPEQPQHETHLERAQRPADEEPRARHQERTAALEVHARDLVVETADAGGDVDEAAAAIEPRRDRDERPEHVAPLRDDEDADERGQHHRAGHEAEPNAARERDDREHEDEADADERDLRDDLTELRDRDRRREVEARGAPLEQPRARELAAECRGRRDVVHGVAGDARREELRERGRRPAGGKRRAPAERVRDDRQDLLSDDRDDAPADEAQVGGERRAAESADETGEQNEPRHDERALDQTPRAPRRRRRDV